MQMLWEILWIVLLLYGVTIVLYFLLQERFIFIAVHSSDKATYSLASEFEEVFLETPYNGKIHGLLIKSSEDSKGVVLYFHGNTGSLKRWGVVSEEICSYGFDVFIIDYRGYGKSRGRRSEKAMHNDCEMAFQYLLKQYTKDRIVIYGRSLGSGFAVKLAHKHPDCKLILETPFYSLLEIAEQQAPYIPIGFLLRFPLRSDEIIENIKNPLILFHGTKDRVVPFRSGLKLYEKAGSENKKMITIPGGRHNDLSKFALFREKMRAFLEE
jgi:alpha-beta hydrolase superfamily lysophospholipase